MYKLTLYIHVLFILRLCMYMYIFTYIIKRNYAVNRIHEKAFRSDLPTQKKTSPLTNYLKYLLRITNYELFFVTFFL